MKAVYVSIPRKLLSLTFLSIEFDCIENHNPAQCYVNATELQIPPFSVKAFLKASHVKLKMEI
jgi:hypothetical protein